MHKETIENDDLYFEELFTHISEEILTDETFEKNNELMVLISNDLFDMYRIKGKADPREMGEVLSIVFRHIQRNTGWR